MHEYGTELSMNKSILKSRVVETEPKPQEP
jgi:hypothetical protein